MAEYLEWPPEQAIEMDTRSCGWSQPGSNIALDFHGNPNSAAVTVLSDGNHHMALQETLSGFVRQQAAVNDVFYVTLPPQLLIKIIKNKQLVLGNLVLPVCPDIMLSPPGVIDALSVSGELSQRVPFIKNRGNVLLVRKNNSKNITGVEDIFREDVRIFISNANTEKASHAGYRETLINVAKQKGLQSDKLKKWIDKGASQIMFGKSVHHREAPQALFENQCDVAIVYYHLALRFTRIFPGLFELIPLGGSVDNPQPGPTNVVSAVHMGLFAGCGLWGKKLYDYLQSQAVKKIYARHGLQEI